MADVIVDAMAAMVDAMADVMAAMADAMAGIIGMPWPCDSRCDGRCDGSDGRCHSRHNRHAMAMR